MPHVITLIASGDSPLSLDHLTGSLNSAGVHFSHIEWLAHKKACDLFVKAPPPPQAYLEFTHRCEQSRVDYVLQKVKGREKKLLISDMDSTMIEQECIDELADCVGLKTPVAAITERAMNGELDFKAALRERVALLKDLPESSLQEVFENRITLMPGARELLATMKFHGAYCLLVSGGFRFFTSRVAAALGFDADEANVLEVKNGKLTGTVAEPILDKDAKRAALEHACKTKHIPLEASLAVGDGANDLPMLLKAGLGVAYHAKPIVMAEAHAAIRFNDLSALLYAQGINHKDWIKS